MDLVKIHDLENRLGHKFKDKNLLIQALTHPTFAEREKKKKVGARDCPHQETFCTFGDAVLKTGLILLLMEKGLDRKGTITITKADIENNLKLANVGKRLKLLENDLILHPIKDKKKLQEGANTYCSDTVEALIAAIFIDSRYSLKKTKKSIEKIFRPELTELEKKIT